ncbi:MAG TPA: RidA family protein [Stellaceae bacterium]|nr:RidA family protein [Stellaceae bacterium]
MARTAKKKARKAAPRKAAPRRGARASTRRIIVPPRGPRRPTPLSPAVKVGNLVFVSGTTPYDADGRIAKGDFAAQMHQVMANIKDILAAAGTSLERTVKVVVILVRIGDFAQMNEIYRQYFKEGNYPARTTIGAPLANPDFLLEIECVVEA